MAPNEEINVEELAAKVRLTEVMSQSAVSERRLEVPAGTVLHDTAQPASQLYLIQSGQVRIYQQRAGGSARLLEILGPGDWFGASAFAGAKTYGTVATTYAPSVVLAIQAKTLLDHLAGQPEAMWELVRQVAAKLQAAQEQAGSLVFDDCNSRLIQTLLHFSQSAAASRGAEGVTLRITHQQLAQAVGAARETVSLALTQFRHLKLLETGRNQLTFKPEVLEEFYRRPRGGERVGSVSLDDMTPEPVAVGGMNWSPSEAS